MKNEIKLLFRTITFTDQGVKELERSRQIVVSRLDLLSKISHYHYNGGHLDCTSLLSIASQFLPSKTVSSQGGMKS